MTVAQVVEAALILKEFEETPGRVVTFNNEGSHGVYMFVKPMPRDGTRRTLQEEFKDTQCWLIGRDGWSTKTRG